MSRIRLGRFCAVSRGIERVADGRSADVFALLFLEDFPLSGGCTRNSVVTLPSFLVLRTTSGFRIEADFRSDASNNSDEEGGTENDWE